MLERFDRSYETHIAYDPRGELLQLEEGERVSDYVRRHIREGRIFIGCEGEEPEIAHAVKRVGSKPFLFSSDFPHEVNTHTCRHEIEELMEKIEAQRVGRKLLARCAELPPLERSAVELVDLDGLTPKEAATILGVSRGVLRMRLSRGRARLRKEQGDD